jgi:hypothetical protein
MVLNTQTGKEMQRQQQEAIHQAQVEATKQPAQLTPTTPQK